MNVNICASINAKTYRELRMMVKKAEEAGANLIEIRMDYMKKRPELDKIRALTTLPLIGTNRLTQEGGVFKGKEEERISLLLDAVSNGFNVIDLELETKNVQKAIKRIRKENDVKLMISHHNLSLTPSLRDINKIFLKEMSLGADVCKIITTAEKIEDNLTSLEFVSQASKIKETICFCMGRLGTPSRLLSPFFGGFFTYASLERRKETAPGQITVVETRRFYEMMRL
jgi:3-dehydroquinate dehydratase type I